MNFKIIERVYIVALLIFRVNFVSILSTLEQVYSCLLYTSDAADDMQCVDLGGRRIIKKND